MSVVISQPNILPSDMHNIWQQKEPDQYTRNDVPTCTAKLLTNHPLHHGFNCHKGKEWSLEHHKLPFREELVWWDVCDEMVSHTMYDTSDLLKYNEVVGWRGSVHLHSSEPVPLILMCLGLLMLPSLFAHLSCLP
jgi:hypothetical protein